MATVSLALLGPYQTFLPDTLRQRQARFAVPVPRMSGDANGHPTIISQAPRVRLCARCPSVHLTSYSHPEKRTMTSISTWMKATLLLNGESRNQIQVCPTAKPPFFISKVTHFGTSGSHKGSVENVFEAMTSPRSPGMTSKVSPLSGPRRDVRGGRNMQGYRSGDGEEDVITDGELGIISW